MSRIQVKGINRLPKDDHEKEKNLAPILLSLSDFLIQEGKYREALELCLLGNEASIKRNKGRYTPDFLLNMARCNHYIKNVPECRRLLQYTYFGFSLMRRKEQAEHVRVFAQSIGIQFDTYGVENLMYDNIGPKIAHGESATGANIGEFIFNLRKKAGISQSELCEGVCSQSTLARIERGEIRDNVYFLEAFMQRLGRDINKYFSTFLSKEEFMAKQMRDEVNSRLVTLKFESAAELLVELKEKKSYKNGFGLQFVKGAEATIFASREGWDNPRYLKMLEDALKITKPKFDEKMVDRYRLTYQEIILVNEIAMYYCESKKLSRGIRLFERLRDSMDDHYVDEHEKMRMYTLVLYNCSKYMGQKERYAEALEIVTEGENLELKHRQLTLLPSFAINRACCMLETGKKKESVPYFALAYYGFALLGESFNQQATANYVEEHLEMVFD